MATAHGSLLLSLRRVGWRFLCSFGTSGSAFSPLLIAPLIANPGFGHLICGRRVLPPCLGHKEWQCCDRVCISEYPAEFSRWPSAALGGTFSCWRSDQTRQFRRNRGGHSNQSNDDQNVRRKTGGYS